MTNSMYMIGNLMSMIAAGSLKIQASKEESTRRFNGEFKNSFSNNIPEIVTHGIYVNDNFLKTGTIVIRPLSKEILTDISGEYHYAVVLGMAPNGVAYFLEMTNYPHNIRIVDTKGFLDGYPPHRLKINTVPKKDFTPQEIYAKAKRFEDNAYSLLNLNCKDVAFYCIYDIEPERRGDAINKCMLTLNELCIKLDELYLETTTDPAMKKFHQENIKRLQEERKTISESLRKSESPLPSQK